MRNPVTVCTTVTESEYEKIMFSNVLVTRKRNIVWGRNWRTIDFQFFVTFVLVHLLALFAPFTFDWNVLVFVFFKWAMNGIGLTLSYHRNLAHHSLKLPKWLEYLFAYFGVLAFQWDPISWVSVHRLHHKYVDSEKDTHSPTFGFWYSHAGWLFDSAYIIEKFQETNNVDDLKNQVFYRFIQRTYILHLFAHVCLIYAYGGFSYIVWVVGVMTTWSYHVTFLVNSACHVWGTQKWDTGDLSKNNWWVALLTFGEGWHNNHHAFEYSARHGLEFWQFDLSWYIIRFLEALGLATNVKLPTEAHKLKKSFTSHNKFK
ncbi:unnamed protein product [Lactuca saligna]|uniref:Fatty acid desaturase domain-containing protein n=1 Tax=Lactuca saligna TaxID=75948 RepID=A0AA35UT55_LACSI|nr:unnamed protein product [Lactuca saligna]